MDAPSALPFQVIYATSEIDSNPASNLMDTSPFANGWITLPNASYPQEVILDFGSQVALTEMKFISHQSKIASSIDLLSGGDKANWRKVQFEQIDSFKFTDNRANNYKAREIRVAHPNMLHLRYIKIKINGCYQNHLNKSNQVGLISFSARGYGEENPFEDEQLLNLERAKQEAIEREDFDRAKAIKAKIDIIRDNRAFLQDLKQRKIEAIRNEDFDLAKQLKIQEENILAGNDDQNFNDFNEPPPKPHPRRKSSLDPDVSQFSQQQYNPPPQNYPVYLQEPEASEVPYQSERFDDTESRAEPQERPIRPMKTDLYTGDHRPMNFGHNQWDNIPPGEEYDRPIKSQPSAPPLDDDGEHLDALDPNQRAEADIVIKVCGEEAAQQFYSKNTDLRQAGIKAIAQSIRKLRGGSAIQAYEKFLSMLKPCVKDNSQGVFVKSVDEIMKLTDKLKPPPDVVRSSIEAHKHAIFAKLGNKRMMQPAVEFFTWAAGNSALGVQFVAPVVMAPLKQPVQWTAVIPRLDIIQTLIKRFGGEEGVLDTSQIIAFVMLLLDAPKADVRQKAMSVLEMLNEAGLKSQVIKMIQAANLPNGKKIIDQLEAR